MPLSRKGDVANGHSTRVTSKEAPQAVSKLEMRRQGGLPLDPCRLVFRIRRSWDQVWRRRTKTARPGAPPPSLLHSWKFRLSRRS